jgi:hypothetical protein
MERAVLAACVMALPLWLVAAPAMPDYPAHLASYYLIAGGASRYYHVAWAFLPNLAGEIVVPLLSRLVGLALAAKLFMTAGVAMWVIGPALIQRALFGRIGASALFAALFAYNANFLWGFLNYYFAMGAGFVFFAFWITTAAARGPKHYACFALAATAIYFSHLFALAVLVLLIAGYELGKGRRDLIRRGALAAGPFAPAALAFLALKPMERADNGTAFNLFDTAFDRIDASLMQSFDNPSYVLLALLIVLLAVSAWQGWLRLHRDMRVPLILVALGALLAPEWAMGGWAVHMRLPAVLFALLFASSEFAIGTRPLGIAAAALIAFNSAALAKSWLGPDRQFAEFREALSDVPKNARLVTVLDGDAIYYGSDQPYWHMAEFAIVDRAAFTPLLFTTHDQHVVHTDPEVAPYAAASAGQGSPPDIDELDDLSHGRVEEDEDIRNIFPYLLRFQCHYDIAVVVHLGGPRSVVPAMLTLRHEGSFFALYDIKRTPPC